MKELNFTIGENIGVLLQTIAQEHFLYDFNFNKALKAIQESLIGIPRELAIKVILGTVTLSTDVESQEVVLENCLVSDSKRTVIDVKELITKHSKDLSKRASGLYSGIYANQSLIKQASKINLTIPQILKLQNGLESEEIDDLRYENEGLDYLLRLIDVLRKLLLEWSKFQSFVRILVDEGLTTKLESDDNIANLQSVYTDLNSGEYEKVLNREKLKLKNYFDAQEEISEVISKGIQPVNHKEFYDAGWISPEGTYYALKGEIANMLHNQISDALYEAGIIEQSEKNEDNPDLWLDKNGWVKQHGNWILFGSYTYPTSKGIEITEAQMKVIHELIGYNHKGIVKCGFSMERMSSAKLQMYDKYALRKLFGL